jgi:CHASE3 domain sensor protein
MSIFKRRKTLGWRQNEIKNSSRLFVVTLLFFLSVGSFLYSVNYVSAQTDQAPSKLQAANTAVEQAFNSVVDAEKAGANVTDLLTRLNVAEGILAQAENSYRVGDSANASVQAESVLPIAQQVNASAHEAKQNAIVSGQNAYWSAIAFAIIGSLVFVLVLFVFWRWFKRRYINNLSQLKPEVNG